MKVLTFSKVFPTGHPRAGQPTWFVERVMAGIAEDNYPNYQMPKDFTQYDWHQYYNCSILKRHTIRAGSRWKAGDMASLRIWSGRPYMSKQIEFAQVEIKKVWDIEIGAFWFINGNLLYHEEVIELAKNDGLHYEDFVSWFNIHPKKKDHVFKGQIICWSDKINYIP